jgi:Peptidase family M28/PKD domain
MPGKTMYLLCLCLLAVGLLLPSTTFIRASFLSNGSESTTDFATVDPTYIYDQLAYMTGHFLKREAGYDTNLSPTVNGHDEFAAYWSQEMTSQLHDFGAQVQRDTFPVKGWLHRPAPVKAFNVEVSVPGAIHPEQVVVIGCHYDSEATSTQSAFDDASGCAIELGVARALGDFWRSHHLYPARTLRFVIFDAEEQGIFGSFHYVNNTVSGDISNIVAMFNEEQNGIAYPLRYLGQLRNPLLPFYIDISPLKNNYLYPAQSRLSAAQRERIVNFRTLMTQAIPAVFRQFQALGYQGLTYHIAAKQDSAQPIFTPDQLNNVILQDDNEGGSDQIPFTLAGLPCATFVSNATYYDNHPPAWSYPFDQSSDTLQLMNTFASGGSHKSNALTLALALPGMLTTWMLHQPGMLGEVDASTQTGPLTTISDIGQIRPGEAFKLLAATSTQKGSPTFSWNFGDGSSANGSTVTHSYTQAGNYTLTLTASSATGSKSVTKTIIVATQSTIYPNPYENIPQDGNPPNNPQVQLPVPNDSLTDAVLHKAVPTMPSAPSTATQTRSAQQVRQTYFPWIVGAAIILVAGIFTMFVIRRKRRV